MKSSWHSSTLSFGSQEDEQDIIIVSLIEKNLIFLLGLRDDFQSSLQMEALEHLSFINEMNSFSVAL